MSLADLAGQAGWLWVILAVALGLAELAVPGVFLIFLAIAAAITGIATLTLADLSLPVQLVSFGVWSAVTVLIGKRWYGDYPIETSDPMLNDRGARLVGAIVTVSDAIEHGAGRVRVGDGTWPAVGDDAPAGASVRVQALRNGALVVAPIEPPPPR